MDATATANDHALTPNLDAELFRLGCGVLRRAFRVEPSELEQAVILGMVQLADDGAKSEAACERSVKPIVGYARQAAALVAHEIGDLDVELDECAGTLIELAF